MIPRFPFWGNNPVANHYLLSLVPFPVNFDYLDIANPIPLTLLQYNCHVNLQIGFGFSHKKARKKVV
jgi:hypothetical protein